MTQVSARKKILIVSQFYSPDVTAAAFRIKETATLLAAAGHSVTVITGEPHKGIIDQVDDSQEKGVQIVRVRYIPYAQKGKWSYAIHYISFMLAAALGGILAPGRFDAIFASSPPLFVGVAGLFIAWMKKSRLFLDIRDIWPDSAVSAGVISPGGPFFRWGKKMEQWLYRRAFRISGITTPMAEYIRQFTEPDKVFVMYNGVPEEYLNSERVETMAENEDGLHLVYAGNLGRCQNLQIFLDAALELKRKGEGGTYFHFVGNGIVRGEMEDFCAVHKLDNVSIRGPVSKMEAFEEMKKGSALFLSLVDDPTMEKTIPSKVFDYLAAGRPIIFGIRGEGKEILERTGGNLFFEPNSVESLVEAIRTLKGELPALSAKALKNVDVVKENFGREKMVQRLIEELEKL